MFELEMEITEETNSEELRAALRDLGLTEERLDRLSEELMLG